MKLAAAQINPTIGDIEGNVAKILQFTGRAKELGAELVVFPELCLTGYPPRDLLERSYFIDGNLEALGALAKRVTDMSILVGYVEKNPSTEGKPLYNAAALLEKGEITYVCYKSLLPTYDVFDEERYFEPAAGTAPVKFGNLKVAITICEDIWTDEVCGPRKLYHKDPLVDLAKKKINLLINLSASPWCYGKETGRIELLKNKAREYNAPIILCNQVGGNDELIFDGNSLAVDAKGEVIARARAFEEDLIMIDLDYGAGDLHVDNLGEADAIYRALVLGTRDYTRKCGFSKAVVGLSGGVDSALVACIAAEALGPENVLGVSMPSPYNAEASKTDAEALAKNLGIQFKVQPIHGLLQAYLSEFASLFEGRPPNVTEENVQARIRGTLLMALSNKLGSLVLSTGNKSELSTGYCTLYGDMCGGLAVLGDVPKLMVYRIAREVVNRDRGIIPQNTLSRPPSAELRPNQKDSDSLPEYEKLDPILKLYIEEERSPEAIVGMGHPPEIVRRVAALVERNEYKRRQSAPMLKVTSKAFGMGRRYPIARRI